MAQELTGLLDAHRARRPEMQAQDYYKLLYQREFGCGHMAPAPDTAAQYLLQEYTQAHGAPAQAGGLAMPGSVEPIGNGLCRVSLDGAWSQEALRLLARIFCVTARVHTGSAKRFDGALAQLARWASDTLPAADAAALDQTLDSLRAQGLPAVHHSEAYRAAYAPHYRVVRQCYIDFWPALLLAQRTAERAAADAPALLAVDGRCGSGKSTLGSMLGQVFDCPVFHMDDFFLPPALRTPERLAQPGENVHHERFLHEILQPFAAGQPVRFCPFNCSLGAYDPPAEVPAAPFAVVEGSYALHPALRDYYAASVFVTCAPDVQRTRLIARGGAQAWPAFESRWIPLEESYFAACGIGALADLTLDTTAFPAQ